MRARASEAMRRAGTERASRVAREMKVGGDYEGDDLACVGGARVRSNMSRYRLRRSRGNWVAVESQCVVDNNEETKAMRVTSRPALTMFTTTRSVAPTGEMGRGGDQRRRGGGARHESES